jgi:pimeloyl-ACP methyl ester carboxylesterase
MSEVAEANSTHKIEKPYYPIVYVRGYAMTESEREDVYHDAYYGFSATSVEKRDAAPPKYFEVDIFEGQFIRLMKMKMYGYADAVNRGLHDFHDNPTRSIWISRFYDRDYLGGTIRPIEDHAAELCDLIAGPKSRTPNAPQDDVRSRLKAPPLNCDFGPNDEEFKVILVAHSMGGLVCRCLIQKVMPERGLDPSGWIHRLVTIGSPHGGIELSRVPDSLQRVLSNSLNPFDAGMFHPTVMRKYLNLGEDEDPRSLGKSRFPIKRCFCIIGSDYHSYSAVQYVTGGFSDGLVKQDRAYCAEGSPDPTTRRFPEEQQAYGANVHRAHSGNRGIVNSYESYENLTRFLFGNIRASISLGNFSIASPRDPDARFFYDLEFLASIKGTGVYLQRREQDPCENAMRFPAEGVPKSIDLYTGFLRSEGKSNPESQFVEFALILRVIEHRVEHRLLWDHEYPGRQIYNETLLIGVGDTNPNKPGDEVSYMWLSDREKWREVDPQDGVYAIKLRKAKSVSGEIRIEAAAWPDLELTKDAPSPKPPIPENG